MIKFNVEVELTDEEINFIKNVDWNSKSPNCEYSDRKLIHPLEEKGILVEYSDRDGCENWLFLTNIGTKILNCI
jgi:hypothetical protein